VEKDYIRIALRKVKSKIYIIIIKKQEDFFMTIDSITDGRLRVPTAAQQVAQGIALEREKQKAISQIHNVDQAKANITPTEALQQAAKAKANITPTEALQQAAKAKANVMPTGTTSSVFQKITQNGGGRSSVGMDKDLAHGVSGIGKGVGQAIGSGTNLVGKSFSALSRAASEHPLTAAAIAGGAGLAYALKKRRTPTF
jgi:hypothetical protein